MNQYKEQKIRKIVIRNDTALVVGCGSIGLRHIENLQRCNEKSIVAVDTDMGKHEDAKAAGATKTFAEVDQALVKADPEYALVCVPNHLHVPISKTLAESGLDLFIEKPLSHTLEGTQELVNVASENNLVTLVGCNLRFHPGVRQIHERVNAGEIGTPTTVRIEGGSYLPEWHPNQDYRELYSAKTETGGGAILDYIHEINYARWFFGAVKSVSAMTGSRSNLEIETEDTAGILLEFTDGPIGEIHVDYIQRPYSRSCKVVGTEGTIIWEWNNDTVEEYDPRTEAWKSFTLPDWEMNDMYVDELTHFLECRNKRKSTICEIQDGLADLQVALAAKRAAKNEQHVTPQSETGNHE